MLKRYVIRRTSWMNTSDSGSKVMAQAVVFMFLHCVFWSKHIHFAGANTMMSSCIYPLEH